METGDFLEAEQLLAALRAGGCIVETEGDQLAVEGVLTKAQRALIIALKSELLVLLAVERQRQVRAPTPRDQGASTPPKIASPMPEPTPPEDAPPQPKHPPSPPLPRGPVRAGVAIATPEMLRWRALRDDAVRDGRHFDLPPPRYRYPEFEVDNE
jgi:hypothetical protein